MKYFKTSDFLIQFNPETSVYKIRNTISTDVNDKVISEEKFNSLSPTQIKKTEFCRLMNIFFKNVKHEWVYNHTHFKKLDNFEESEFSLSSNYIIGKDIPIHLVGTGTYKQRCILVYHWGRVYYHTISYGGYKQGHLIDLNTFDFVQWARLKNCSPIYNENTKIIC